jgi:hypothetical protein
VTIVEYTAEPADRVWTKEWEKGTITRLAELAGYAIPERPLSTRPPAPGDASAQYYACYASVAGLDQFIYQSCAGGMALVDDSEFQLLLTRQIGDDGSHAQRYREVVAKQTGADPLSAIAREARHQRDLVGDLTGRGLAGFLAFEISYELYTAPEFLVLGRTALISDADLLVSGAERFGPDEFVHRQGVANWWRVHLGTLASEEAAELTDEVLRLDKQLWQRRNDDIDQRWLVAEDATQADYRLIRAIREAWRQEVHTFLFSDRACAPQQPTSGSSGIRAGKTESNSDPVGQYRP